MTKGPYCTTGSSIGLPAISRNLNPASSLVVAVTWSPGPNTRACSLLPCVPQILPLPAHTYAKPFHDGGICNAVHSTQNHTIMSPALPCRALPCPAVPRRALPCRAVHCPALPCPAIMCHVVMYKCHRCCSLDNLQTLPQQNLRGSCAAAARAALHDSCATRQADTYRGILRLTGCAVQTHSQWN